MSKFMEKRNIFTVVVFVFFVVLISFGYFDYKKETASLNQNGVFTTGMIVEIKQQGTFRNNSSRGYLINYEYKVNNITYKDQESLFRKKDLKEGQKVTVLYSEENPKNSKLVLD